jgi:hypothetical protein
MKNTFYKKHFPVKYYPEGKLHEEFDKVLQVLSFQEKQIWFLSEGSKASISICYTVCSKSHYHGAVPAQQYVFLSANMAPPLPRSQQCRHFAWLQLYTNQGTLFNFVKSLNTGKESKVKATINTKLFWSAKPKPINNPTVIKIIM